MDAINQGMLFFVSAYQSSDLFKIIAYIVILLIALILTQKVYFTELSVN